MKATLFRSAIVFVIVGKICSPAAAGESGSHATRLVARAETHTLGKSFQGVMRMIVETGGSTRELRFRAWTEGKDKALIKILEPAKDRGAGNLRLKLDLWQYLPNVERVIKIPTSMMLQSWMGSDFTNDDLVKASSLLRDYDHKDEGKEKVGDQDAVKIRCTPKPEAPVVWGKVYLWVRARDAVPLQQEFYSEKGDLLKKMSGSEIKSFGTHTIPTRLVMKNLKKEGSQTTLIYDEVKFDEQIPGKVFTQENLRRSARD